MADIKVLDRNTPVLVGGSTQKEILRSGCRMVGAANAQTRWNAR